MKKQSSFGDIILDIVEAKENDLLRAVRKEAELEDQIWYYTLLGGDFEKAKKQVSSPRIRKIIEGMERDIEEMVSNRKTNQRGFSKGDQVTHRWNDEPRMKGVIMSVDGGRFGMARVKWEDGAIINHAQKHLEKV